MMWPFTRKETEKRPSFARPPLRRVETEASPDTGLFGHDAASSTWLLGVPFSDGGYLGAHHPCDLSSHAAPSIDMGSCGAHHGGGSGF